MNSTVAGRISDFLSAQPDYDGELFLIGDHRSGRRRVRL